MKETIRHACINCKHFQQHYFWCKNKFLQAHCGFCMQRKISKNEYKKFPFFEGCEIWEMQEVIKPKDDTHIKELLVSIERKLEQIYYYLYSKE